LSRGVILADEVGLGKTIEAGLVLAQHWAERKRRIIIIVPANLRKQWHQELQDKFALDALILETKNYNQLKKNGISNPFDAKLPVICSYQFAKSKINDVRAVLWDLVVFDEAHRLRNVYKPSNVIANALKEGLARVHSKVLLTATYLYKRGDDDPPRSETVFDVREAASALACTRTTSDWPDYVIAAKSDKK